MLKKKNCNCVLYRKYLSLYCWGFSTFCHKGWSYNSSYSQGNNSQILWYWIFVKLKDKAKTLFTNKISTVLLLLLPFCQINWKSQNSSYKQNINSHTSNILFLYTNRISTVLLLLLAFVKLIDKAKILVTNKISIVTILIFFLLN